MTKVLSVMSCLALLTKLEYLFTNQYLEEEVDVLIPALSRLDFKILNCLTGISVYVTDMVELTDKIAATLVHGGDGAVAVMDAGVVEMREEVTRAVEGYVAAAEEGGGGVGVKRMVAVATMNNMHQDVCILAEDLMVSLIVMPFHKEEQAGDGRLGVGHSGFRHVNRKVRDESFGNSLFFHRVCCSYNSSSNRLLRRPLTPCLCSSKSLMVL